MMALPVTILLVDDDAVNAMAIKRSFRELKITNPVVKAHNGIERATADLARFEYTAPRSRIRDDHLRRRRGPEAYDKNIAGYVLKHRPEENFLEAIRMLELYWRTVEFSLDSGTFRLSDDSMHASRRVALLAAHGFWHPLSGPDKR
jgi:hypothetical protein